jgi:filamentous hemagglutinin
VAGLAAGGAGIAKNAAQLTNNLGKAVLKRPPAKMIPVDNSAHNVANGLRLRTELAFQEAGILGRDGKLTAQAIQNAEPIKLQGGVIKNPEIVKILTHDGSNIADWEKFTTNSITLKNGQSMQIHFYKNVKTGIIDYTSKDYKVKGIVKP